MPIQHATAIFFNEFFKGDTSGGKLDARLFHMTGDRKGAQSSSSIASMRFEPVSALLKDLSDPINGLDIVDQCWAAKDTILRNIGRSVPRKAAFALD